MTRESFIALPNGTLYLSRKRTQGLSTRTRAAVR